MKTPATPSPALTELTVDRKTLDRALSAVAEAMAELSNQCADDDLSANGLQIVTEGRGALETLGDAFRNASPAASPIPNASPNVLDLLRRALEYVEDAADDAAEEAERMELLTSHSDAHERRDDARKLAHAIRNALHAATLAEGEDMSAGEAAGVRAVMLDALRRAEKALGFAIGSVPTSTAAHVALLGDRDAVRAAIATIRERLNA